MQVIRGFFKRLFHRWEDNPTDQNYYVKILFAVLTAIVCGIAGPSFAGIRGVVFGSLVYGLTLYVIEYGLEIDPVALGGRRKMITNSLPSYLLLWVLLWTLFYAFTIPPSVLEGLAI